MECNCVKDVEEKLIGHIYKKRAVNKATFLDSALILAPDGLHLRTGSRVQVMLDGLGKSQVLQVMHSYCPFCGKEIVKTQTEEPTTPVTES